MSDQKYMMALARGLKISDTKLLSVIMGPAELKKALSGLTMSDFDDGIRLITLHNHTAVSDGQVEPDKYLDNALAFKKKYGYKSLILGITDHDLIDALPVVLKQIVKNPKKYQGIRVVLGCELSVSLFASDFTRPIDFELLHYGINPFDKGYVRWLSELRQWRQQSLPHIFDVFQKRYPNAGLSLDEFLSENPLMKKGFGCYLAYITPRYIIRKVNDATQNELIWDYFRRLGSPLADEPDKPFWHTLDDVMTRIRQHGFGFVSVAHPYRIQLGGKITGDGPTFLKHFLEILKEKGVQGLEIFYMNLSQPLARSLDYMLAGHSPWSETDRWVRTILDFADENQMIKTGGTDSHISFLAGKKRQLVLALTERLEQYKTLIQEGYRVLNKEVTLGLPAPCMPPADRTHDTGIGSAVGAGAERLIRFFGGMFDKIQLGPMGRTLREAKHSPYVSDMAPNPFFIPLEKLVEAGLISEKTMEILYDIPKPDGKIDFSVVEQVYTKALQEAYQNSRTRKSYSDFIKDLSDKYLSDSPAKYIADLQVRIPSDAPGLQDDLFLPGFSLGSPPDHFSKMPRNWHFRVFHPNKIFNPDGSLGPAGQVWYHIIDNAMKHARGGLRIDHFIGFVNPFVISDENPDNNGRLYSSPNNPDLAPFVKTDFTDIARKIVLDCAAKNGLTARDIYIEDIGSRPAQLDEVIDRCGFGRLLVAEFMEPDNWNHIYRLSLAKPNDVAVLDTHDTPSVQMFFESLPPDKRAQFSWLLANDLRFNYTDDLKSVPQLVRMQWGALLASPAERVQAFFTSWTGQIGRYNEPGNPVKWQLRCVTDFERLYFENLAKGMAYNPFDAIALAIYARGDDFYHRHEELVGRLRRAETDILNLAKEL
ncbi:MAG: 4-alpha-glucanotransferase [Alphaproteobacteria bacterium]|nr:4-alpha-glucanotransferase [Alphaproteobacteria bacterium]